MVGWYGRNDRKAILHEELRDPGVRVEQLHALWVDNRFVTQLAQHLGRVRRDPVGGLISAGQVDKNYELFARGNKNIPQRARPE